MQKRTRLSLFLLAFTLLMFWAAVGEPRPGTKKMFAFLTAIFIVVVTVLAFAARTGLWFLRRRHRNGGGTLSLVPTEALTIEQVLERLADHSHRWYVDFSEAHIMDAHREGDGLRVWWAGTNECWPIDFHPLLIDGSIEGLLVIWEDRTSQVKNGATYDFVDEPSPTGWLVRDDLMLKVVMDTYAGGGW